MTSSIYFMAVYYCLYWLKSKPVIIGRNVKGYVFDHDRDFDIQQVYFQLN